MEFYKKKNQCLSFLSDFFTDSERERERRTKSIKRERDRDTDKDRGRQESKTERATYVRERGREIGRKRDRQ